MKYKTLFRLALKLLGVFLIAKGIVSTINSVTNLVVLYFRVGPVSFSSYWFGFVPALSECALGLFLFIEGKWIADKAIPGNRPYCPECGYDLTGCTHNRCSECGTPFKWEDVLPSPETQHNEKAS